MHKSIHRDNRILSSWEGRVIGIAGKSVSIISAAAIAIALFASPAAADQSPVEGVGRTVLDSAHAAALVKHARELALSGSTTELEIASALAVADQAVPASEDDGGPGFTGGSVRPMTYNANGVVCHWYGYCDIRLSNSNAMQIVDLIAMGVGAAGLCSAISGMVGAIPVAGVCGIAGGLLTVSGAWITYLVDHYHGGIFIRVFTLGTTPPYIWHQ